MEKIRRNFRIAVWGILGAFGVYTGMILFNNVGGRGSIDMVYILKILLIPGSVLFLELVVYWLIRKRLYYRAWIWIHVISVWLTIVVMPLTYIMILYYNRHNEMTERVRLNEYLAGIFATAFLITIAVGLLFFILTIVKSFSKKKRMQLKPDATNSPHILDEFNQQSAGI